MTTLDAPLHRVVSKRQGLAALEGLGLQSVEDLLCHFPRRCLPPARQTAVADLRVGVPAVVGG